MVDIATLPLLANASLADDDWTIIYDTSDGMLKRVRKDGLTAEQAADIDSISQWGGGNKTVTNNLAVGGGLSVTGETTLSDMLNAAAALFTGALETNSTFEADGNATFRGDLALAGDLNLTDETQLQPDWDQTTTTAKDFIKNKPSIAGYTLRAGIIPFTGSNTPGTPVTIGGDAVTVAMSGTTAVITHNIGNTNYLEMFFLSHSAQDDPIARYVASSDKENNTTDVRQFSGTSAQNWGVNENLYYLFIYA